MEFHSGLNLLLEALAYLGRRAGGYDTAWMLDRLQQHGVVDKSEPERLSVPITELTNRLDRALPFDEERLRFLFGNLPGFPYNRIGSYSRAFLMLYPMVSRFRGCCAEPAAWARARTPGQLAWDLASTLDLADDSSGECTLSGEEFSARVLTLPVTAESKVAVLELYHQGSGLFEEALDMAEQVVRRMERERPLLELCAAEFVREIRDQGPEALLSQTSALNTNPGRSDVVHPFVYGMDTLLAVTPPAPGPVQVYCGVLRRSLQAALASARGPEVEVCEAIRLMADQTRFDILCYLRDHDAYGQELAAKFGLSRNTIHHHMSKLLAAHLVKCTVDGNRIYYRVDETTISRLLDRQRELLMPDA